MRAAPLSALFLSVACSAAEPPPRPAGPEAPDGAVLVLIDSIEGQRSARELGLSGHNKPNGIQYRLRESVPGDTPEFIPRSMGDLTLWVADRVDDGWLAFYREPLGSNPGSLNSRYHATLHSHDGSIAWSLSLDPFLSAPTHLEIQDVRYEAGSLYFNGACQSYSREADGRCSALVRVDPVEREVVWRTRDRISNDIFMLHGKSVVAGYGFTAEPDSLFLVDRETGEVSASHPLATTHSYMEVSPAGRLMVITRNRVYEFAVR